MTRQSVCKTKIKHHWSAFSKKKSLLLLWCVAMLTVNANVKMFCGVKCHFQFSHTPRPIRTIGSLWDENHFVWFGHLPYSFCQHLKKYFFLSWPGNIAKAHLNYCFSITSDSPNAYSANHDRYPISVTQMYNTCFIPPIERWLLLIPRICIINARFI